MNESFPSNTIENKFQNKIEDIKKFTNDSELVDLILVWKGYKNASEVIVGDIYPEIEEVEWPKVEVEIEALFKEMNLEFTSHYKNKEFRDETEVHYRKIKEYAISKNQESLQQFDSIEDDVSSQIIDTRRIEDTTLGESYGFPSTAIEAYMKGEEALIDVQFLDLPKEIREQDYMAFAGFRLSKDNWQEELETVKKWAEEIKKVDSLLYERQVKEYKGSINL